MDMKKNLILLSVLFASFQISAQNREVKDSIYILHNLMLQKAIDYYFNAPQNQIDTKKIVILVLPACHGTFDKAQLKLKNNSALIVPCVDSACTFFNKELHVLVSLDWFTDRREFIWSNRIWIGELELNCDGKTPIAREKEAKARKKGSFSIFVLNKNRTKITSERHQFN
jgi:hypothetical protein